MPYQIKNGNWRAVKMIDGKRKTKLFATKAEAKKWEAAQTREEWQESSSKTLTICWLEFLTAYLDMVKRRLSEATFAQKRYILLSYLLR